MDSHVFRPIITAFLIVASADLVSQVILLKLARSPGSFHGIVPFIPIPDDEHNVHFFLICAYHINVNGILPKFSIDAATTTDNDFLEAMILFKSTL